MTKQDFINRVLLIMNEAGMIDAQGNQFTGADAAQVDRYIEGSYVDAWRRCVKVMPRSWFANSVMPTTGTKHVADKATGQTGSPGHGEGWCCELGLHCVQGNARAILNGHSQCTAASKGNVTKKE